MNLRALFAVIMCLVVLAGCQTYYVQGRVDEGSSAKVGTIVSGIKNIRVLFEVNGTLYASISNDDGEVLYDLKFEDSGEYGYVRDKLFGGDWRKMTQEEYDEAAVALGWKPAPDPAS